MEILTGEQMRRIDRRAIEESGIPGLRLMEAAGRGVAERILADYPDARDGPIVILCGKGNNGGDGLVVARRLALAGIAPRVFLLARAEDVAGDAAANLDSVRQAGIEVHEIPDGADCAELFDLLGQRPLVVDALLGTGVRGGARGLVAKVIDEVNRHGSRVVAIDLPSGVDGDSSRVRGPSILADHTYTLCRPKLPLVFSPAAERSASWSVVPIGIPEEAIRLEAPDLEWLDADAASELLPARHVADHKGDLGHVLAIAGAAGKSGAAVLLSRGALRCGVGLMTVATAESVSALVAVQQAEIMTETLPETDDGGLAGEAGARALSLADTRDALAVGPGLGTGVSTRAVVCEILKGAKTPMVLDADGLNAIAPLAADGPLRDAADPRELVLTPHPGEAARLLSCTAAEIQADRLAAVRELARRSGAVVVLKGYRTLVARPTDGRTAANASGNPGMATGGTGDVLTGAIAAFLARGLTAWDAARLAVFVHGAAGDRAAAELGPDGMIASDLVHRLPVTLASLAASRDE